MISETVPIRGYRSAEALVLFVLLRRWLTLHLYAGLVR